MMGYLDTEVNDINPPGTPVPTPWTLCFLLPAPPPPMEFITMEEPSPRADDSPLDVIAYATGEGMP